MNAEDVLVETRQFRADFVHRKSVGGQVDETGVLCEGKEGSSGIEAYVGGPAAEIRRRSLGEIMVDSCKVEVPAVASLSLHKGILKESPPLGAKDIVLEIVVDGIVASFDVESLQKIEILPHFSKGFVVVLIHWSSVDSEVASDLIKMVAGGCEGHLASDSVASQSGH